MPNVRRHHIPPALFHQLLDRIQRRRISASHLELLARWLDTEPHVPDGPWFKRFAGMTVCGEGDLVRTLFLPDQHPNGQEVS